MTPMTSSLSTKAIKMTNLRFSKRKLLQSDPEKLTKSNCSLSGGRSEYYDEAIMSSISSHSELDSVLEAMKSMQETNLRAVTELSVSVRELASRLDEREKSEGDKKIASAEHDESADSAGPPRRRASSIKQTRFSDQPPQDRRLFLRKMKQPMGITNLSEEKVEDEKEEDDEIDLDRVSIRLDGVEVYAVVSALTLATAVTSFEMIDASHWQEHLQNWNFYKLALIVTNFLCGSVGITGGLHSVIVFSLSLMYGRTAVGLAHDEAYDEFFTKTALQRVRGFRSFLISMYAFMVQMVILIESRCPSLIKPFVIAFVLWLLYEINIDTQAIMKGAECIFRPPEPKKGKEQKRKVGDAAMRGTSMRVLTISSRDLKSSSLEDSDGDED
mmetsp:Transcript_807/g.1078  ORF Transcript_807/g.1078 Transcript_807/m.1078 type:complete len:385 (-) Transcript_807:134-1288(-)